MAHEHHANSLPSELNAPLLLKAWQRRAVVVGAIFAVLSIVLALLAATVNHDGIDHLLRSYLLGFILCWSFTVGGLALLMVQYLSGGKWGLLLRRPLEAMSRCLPLIIVLFLPIGIFMKKLYLWAKYSDAATAYHQHLITHEQAHAITYKHPMLSVPSVWIQSAVCFAIWLVFMFFLNKWGLQRDADTHPNVRFWQVRLENLSGFGVLVYSITAVAGGADEDGIAQDGTTGSGQTGVCLRDAQYLPRLLTVPHHLVGQPAGRDSLVPRSHPWRVGRNRFAGFRISLVRPLYPLAFA
jgi:hypothetical protein